MNFFTRTLCPYCFKEIKLKGLSMRCSSASCLDGVTRHVIPYKGLKLDRNGYGECDVCHKTTRTLVCDQCGQDLPDTIRESETKIISIVGAKASGKSYYVATLLRQIKENGLLSRVAGISANFLPESKSIYDSRYKKNLDSRSKLEGTRHVSDLIKDNPPLLMNMTFIKKNKKFDYTYSFFDAAGESFDDPSTLASVTPYIAHSEAIIIILDPCQIKQVNSAVVSRYPKLGQAVISETSYTDIIDNVARVVYNAQRLDPKKKIKIPLCVAFSKWDLLINTPDLLPAGLVISDPSVSSAAGYNEALVEKASDELRSLLSEWESSVVTAAELRFETVRYFGFSAWGMGSPDGMSPPDIASYRVEDPMLWIMNKNKML